MRLDAQLRLVKRVALAFERNKTLASVEQLLTLAVQQAHISGKQGDSLVRDDLALLVELQQDDFEFVAMKRAVKFKAAPDLVHVHWLVLLALLCDLHRFENVCIHPLLVQVDLASKPTQRDRSSHESEVAVFAFAILLVLFYGRSATPCAHFVFPSVS